LRIFAKQRFGENRAADPPGFFRGQNISTADLVLALSSALIAIALIVGFAPRAPNLD
jgi:hypothetical protein